jgi:hypothetical protein
MKKSHRFSFCCNWIANEHPVFEKTIECMPHNTNGDGTRLGAVAAGLQEIREPLAA